MHPPATALNASAEWVKTAPPTKGPTTRAADITACASPARSPGYADIDARILNTAGTPIQ
jgi:hypothetical protein